MGGLTLGTRLMAEDLFESLGSEEEGDNREIEVERNTGLEKIIAGFNELRYKPVKNPVLMYDECYKIAPMNPRSEDIIRFSLFLKGMQDIEYFDSKAGYYLSALINKSEDKYFELNLEEIKYPIHSLGFLNTKDIIIHGDVDRNLGDNMKCGEITVNGNCGIYVGIYMKGGKININNSAGAVGDHMSGGEINVHGTVGFMVGDHMSGGIINIFGELGDFDTISYNTEGGNIYYKGKQFIREGKPTLRYKFYDFLRRLGWKVDI